MNIDLSAWLASKGVSPISIPEAAPSAPPGPQSHAQGGATARSGAQAQPHRRSQGAWSRALTMPFPALTALALQPVLVSPIDTKEHGVWAALSSPVTSIAAVAVSCAEAGVITSGVWLPGASPYSPPTDVGPLAHWRSTACPEPLARLLMAGAPVIACPLPAAQQALWELGWPEPARWLDAFVQLCTANIDGEWDEVAAWLAGATNLSEITAWSPLRGYNGIIMPQQPLAEAMSQAVVMSRVALGVAARCGASLGTAAENAAWEVDQCINARGLPIDRELIRRVQVLAPEAMSSAANKFTEVETYLCPDDRVRGVYGFVGQHTGRWNAREPAIHNVRKTLLNAAQVQALVELVRAGGMPSGAPLDDLLGNLERPMFCAPLGMVFVVGDQKQAEPRGVFYFAELFDMLEIMDRMDLYMEPSLQKALFGDAVTADHPDAGPRRKALKIVIIACGFGMGATKLREYALNTFNFDFAKAGVDPTQAVKVYRDVFRQVAGLWRTLGEQSIEAISSKVRIRTAVGTFRYEDGNLLSQLHSGRVIVYPRATVVEGKFGKPVMEYWKGGPLRGQRDTAWGGILFQHAVTGTLRDVHAGHLVALETAGLEPVGHCHDEAIGLVEMSRGPAAVATTGMIMSRAPEYLPGLRLRCEPYLTERLGVEGLRR